jgi:hypothetical protein
MLLFDVQLCHVTSSLSNYTTFLHPSLLMIDVPLKMWPPKPEKKCVPLDYSEDIDDNLLVFT